MNRYRLDYIKLHDRSGNQLKSRLGGSLQNEAHVLKNPVCFLAFWLRMQRDLRAYRLVPGANNYDYAVKLLHKLGVLHVDIPASQKAKFRLYFDFVRKALGCCLD